MSLSNDPRRRFDHNDVLWCPRQKNTPRQFECTRLITADAVIAAAERVLGTAGDHARAPRLPTPATPAPAPSMTGTAP